MRKAFLSMVLFLVVFVGANAQYKITKQVVGTGGFISQTAGTYKASGIVGQPFVGAFTPTYGGNTHKMYVGFWTPADATGSVDDGPMFASGIINYPNPVMNSTTFKFTLKENGYVTLNIYNSIGSLVATVAQDEYRDEGDNFITWDANSPMNIALVSSGSYSYELLVVPMVNPAKVYALRKTMMIAK